MAEKRPTTKRYPPELKERAVKMVQELRAQDPRDKTVISRVARQLGWATNHSAPGPSRPRWTPANDRVSPPRSKRS